MKKSVCMRAVMRVVTSSTLWARERERHLLLDPSSVVDGGREETGECGHPLKAGSSDILDLRRHHGALRDPQYTK